MKTKKNLQRSTTMVGGCAQPKVTHTTLPELSRQMSALVGKLNDSSVEDIQFSQIFSQTKNSLMLSASNDHLFVSLTIEMKGGIA